MHFPVFVTMETTLYHWIVLCWKMRAFWIDLVCFPTGYVQYEQWWVLSTFQFINGGNLEQLLAKWEEELPWTQRISLALDMARGVDYLHSRGFFHRDLTSKVTSPDPQSMGSCIVYPTAHLFVNSLAKIIWLCSISCLERIPFELTFWFDKL